MSSTLTVVLLAALGVMAVWTALTAALDRRVTTAHLVGLGVVELLLLAQLVVGVVAVARGDGPSSTATFLAYLIGSLLLLPLAALWSLAERSRPSVLVLTLGCLGLAVMMLRLNQLWSLHG